MHSHRVHTVLAAGTFLTFGFASAIAVGAVPRDHQPGPRVEVAAPLHQRAIFGAATQHAPANPRHRTPQVTRVVVATHRSVATRSSTAHAARPPAATTPSPLARPTPVRSAAHHHRHRAGVRSTTKPATHPAPKPTSKPAKPKLARRTTPSASAVQAAIQGLKKYVHSILTPSPAQVAEFGDMVCSAYDDGDTTKQIEAKILQKVKSLPFTTILPGAADYVVRTAVKLYCPGYQSRLGSAAA
jgi:hypothetical protein